MEDWKVKFRSNKNKIERLLNENEEFLRGNVASPPDILSALEKNEKIYLPKGCIRTAKHFRDEYFLHIITNDKDLKNNIAYSLQAIDLLSFFASRFLIGLSAGSVYIRLSILHVMSIIEALVCGIIDKLHSYCVTEYGSCANIRACDRYIKKAERYSSFLEKIKLLNERCIFELTENELALAKKIIGIRDRVHMTTIDKSDFLDVEFTNEEYQQALSMLHKLRDDIVKNFKNHEVTMVFCNTQHAIILPEE